MKVICAWCLELQREIDPLDDPLITHTICPECHDEVEAEFARGKGQIR